MTKLGFTSIALVLASAVSTLGCGGDEFTEDPNPNTGGSSGGGGSSTGGGGGDAGGPVGGGGGAVGGSGGSGGSPCPDADGDGFMDPACGGADCDDGDDTAFPGNPEVCGDLIDNDCANGADDICGGIGTYVSELGDDNDPGTQQFPVRTIDQGIVNALIIGGGVDVYVDQGSYPEDVELEEGVSLYGGHDSQAGWTRDSANNDSVITAQSDEGMQADNQITRATEVDGFTINGLGGNIGSPTYAIFISGGTPSITNNRVNGGLLTSNENSHGIRIDAPSNNAVGALIAGNLITLGSSNAQSVTGIVFDTPTWPPQLPGALAEVRGNTITGGDGRNVTSIAVWTAGSTTVIADNDITAGSAFNGQSWGIAFGRPSGSFVIDGNRVNVDQGNVGHCSNLPAQNWCGGIVSFSGSAIVTNNVSFGIDSVRSAGAMSWEAEGPIGQMLINANLFDGGGLQSADANSESAALVLKTSNGIDSIVGRIRNNILIGGSNSNRFGVYEDDDVNNAARHARPEHFTNNDFFFAVQAGAVDVLYRDYDGSVFTDLITVAGVNGLAGIGAAANIGKDPKVTLGFHIDATSPCVDAGSPAEAPAADFEGDARPMGAGIDIGPDEAN